MAVYAELFSRHLLRGSQTLFTEQVLGDQVRGVFVFFSANWNPVSHGFLGDLIDFYKHFKEEEGEGIEIVFVSSDDTQQQFNEHFRAMPWLALPYVKTNVQGSLIRRLGVQSIPTLTLVAADGTILAKDCQRMVVQSLVQDRFLFTLSPVPSLLGSEFFRKNYNKMEFEKVGIEGIEGKTIGLYFSYWWEMESRVFSPMLADFCREYKQLDPNFEVVFYSCDTAEWRTAEYFQEQGDYLCHPHGEFMDIGNFVDRVTLRQIYKARTLPSLIILDPTRKVLTLDGVSRVKAGAEEVFRQGWVPREVGDISQFQEVFHDDINHSRCVVTLVDDCPDEVRQNVETNMSRLHRGAQQEAAMTGGDPHYKYFVARRGCMANHLRMLVSKAAGDVLARSRNRAVTILLNVPDGSFFIAQNELVGNAMLTHFIHSAEDGKERKMILDRWVPNILKR